MIVTNLTPATLAAHRATRSIPIVMAGSGDRVATGLVQSLARPGGNVTGVAAMGPELAAKSIELLRELRPGLHLQGVLADATDSFTPAMLAAVAPAAVLALQQNTRFDLPIKLRTARALGIAVPAPLLLRATQVVE